MGSEIKIHLATYLKDAGIKATKQQVEHLAQDIQKMNREAQSGTDKTAASLGKLPGAFGKIQDALGGFAAKAAGVIGAFKVGWDIGTWLNEKVINPLFGIKDPLEELKKHNRELQREAEKAAEKWEEAIAEWSAAWDKEISGAEKARQKVEDLTQAYLKMQAAKERVQEAGDDAKMLGLQRDKFEDMTRLGREGNFDAAAQVGKYYDVLMAEEEAKQKIAKFDREAEVSARRQADAQEALGKAQDKAAMLKYRMAELDKKLAYTQTQAAAEEMGFNGSIAAEEKLLKQKAALQKEIDNAGRDVERRAADVAAMAEARSAEAQERQNVEKRVQLELDERKKAYDDYVDKVLQADEDEMKRRQDAAKAAAEVELRERQKVEKELAAQRLADLRAELAEGQKMQSEAQSRQSAAASGLRTAWGWYRNQSQMQAVIDEQKAQAAAEVQWQKDFERLKTWRRDWRTAEFGSLSASDEAVRQVAFAKEEKAAADRAVIETAENTRGLADKIDELLAMK